MYTNGGAQKYVKLADLVLLPITVRFKENSMATILSLKLVSEIPGVKITMDTDVNKTSIFFKDGHTFVFEQYQNSLYFLDTNKSVETSKSKCGFKNYSFFSTVSGNKTYFTQQEFKGADNSRQLQEYLSFPSSNILKTYVNQNLITNCKITADDINRA